MISKNLQEDQLEPESEPERLIENNTELHCGDSDKVPTLSVILPTLNEESGIADCIDRIRSAVAELGVPTEIIVSDSSTDRTPHFARKLGAIVVTPDKPGYGYAYRCAFRAARGEYIAIGDADTTYDFEELPKLYRLVAKGGADIAIGSRLKGDIQPGAMPALHQYLGNPVLTKFLNTFYDAGVSDAHSGFRVFRAESLKRLDLKTDGMEFASEMIMEAGARGLEIKEAPISYHKRVGDAKLESFRDGWRHVRFMLKNAPGYLFTLPGVFLGVVSSLLLGIIILDVVPAVFEPGIRSLLTAGFLGLIGSQVVSFGMFATVAADPIRQPTDAVTQWLTENVTLERGVTVGLVAFVVGAIYETQLLISWALDGYGPLPLQAIDIIAFGAIALGIQTVFTSFVFDILSDHHRGSTEINFEADKDSRQRNSQARSNAAQSHYGQGPRNDQ